ncbi:Transferase protein [Dioscorea alata]|uniref:Transferase protein n=1 Tax=Dioscorea alata TaxID=55571 RepID=A0ACB7U6E1_DIOAL|nr:Transferase protein [Dioscorea alata]
MPPKVDIIESCKVVPHDETPKHRLWLSNLDIFAPMAHVSTILKNTLSKVLVTFYPLAGRLVFDRDGRPEVDCNAEGVLFSVAHADCTVDGLLTLFKCGGVCLGCALHHSFTDGVSAPHFINAWSEISRGLDIISVPPFLDHTVLHAPSPPKVSFDHIEYTNDGIYTTPTSPPPDDLVRLEECETAILTISKDQLDTLKYGFDGERNLSTFKAVAVHVWRTACKARELLHKQYTRFFLASDVRARLKPPLPMGYLGNAIMRISCHLRVGDLVSKPLELGVSRIEETIKSLDDEYIRSLVDLLEMVEGEKRKAWVSKNIKMTDLVLISWLALPLYEADFRWGKPWFIGNASLRLPGQAFAMHSGSRNSGGVSVTIAFESADMARFKEIFYRDLDSQAV